MRILQPMRRVAGAQLAGLHHERREKCREADEKRGVAKHLQQEAARAGNHRGWRIVVRAPDRFKTNRS